MATYRINISSDEQTITGATYDTCITGLTMDLDTDPHNIVTSTGATNGNFTMHCSANAGTQSREWTYRLVYAHNGGDCEHNIHLVQSGSGGGCTAGTYHYKLNVPQIPQPGVITGPYDIYLCRIHQISNPLEAQSLASTGSTGGTKLEKVGTYYTVCNFNVDSNGNFVSVSDISNKINFVPTGGGDVTKTDFEVNKGYYVCAVQTDDPTKFYPFGTQADLRTNGDVTCADYIQEITN